MKYNPQKIEKKWQKYWTSKKFYETKDQVKDRQNFFLLTEFSYPSGNLHIGHWYAYSIPDILARHMRMRGFNVLYPTGFDAFGLPAENAAIKNSLQPKDYTDDNIAYMRKQLRSMGTTFDWSREVVTANPSYYKWTQWMFLQFYKASLAYRAKTMVNWCPKDKTVLANEQLENGHCFRCGSAVIQKELTQWMMAITKYADRLIDDLDKVDYLENVKLSQRNWIGRSQGAEIEFVMEDGHNKVKVFTTRPDTIFGATFLVIAPETAQKWITDGWNAKEEVRNYIEKSSHKTELERQEQVKDKSGVFSGVYAVNPATKSKIPVWIADYVLGSYGTGGIMAVPAHDERDFEFAKKYKLPVTEVVMPSVVDHVNPPRSDKPTIMRTNVHAIVYNPKRKAYLALHSEKFDWNTVIIGGVEEGEGMEEAAKREVREETGYTKLVFKRVLGGPVQAAYFAKHKDENRVARATGLYFELIDEETVERLHPEVGDVIWVPAKDFVPGKMVNSELPYWLERLNHNDVPYIGHGILINSGMFDGLESEPAKAKITESVGGQQKTTYRLRDWALSRQRYWGTPIPMISCPDCGYQPVPEKDLPVLLPRLEDYKPSSDGRSPLAKATKWLKVKCPKCGGEAERETDTMDTFVDSSWYFLRYIDPKNKKAFADKKQMAKWLPVDFYSGGAEHTTMHLLYSRFWIKAMHDLGLVSFDEPYKKRRNRGLILDPSGHQKISKSKGNVIDPDKLVEQYGADTVRMYLAFLAPYDQGGPWDSKGIIGVFRFLNRVSSFTNSEFQKTNLELESILHRTIKKVGEDIENLKFNTAVSELMKLLNEFEKNAPNKKQFETLLKLLAPFTPHMTEEIWQEVLGHKKSIHLETWPEYDKNLLIEDTVKIPVQINGKVREILELAANASEEEVRRLVLDNPKIKSQLVGKTPKKFVYVTGKILNIVV